MTETVYRIKRLSDGLYSQGGMTPRFGEKPKTWRTRGALSNHLRQFSCNSDVTQQLKCPKVYRDCVIERVEIREEVLGSDPVSDWGVDPSIIAANQRRREEVRAYSLRQKNGTVFDQIEELLKRRPQLTSDEEDRLQRLLKEFINS